MGLAVRDSLVIFHCVKVNDVPSLEIIGIPSPFPAGEPDRPKHLSMQISRIGMRDMQPCSLTSWETESVLTGEQGKDNEIYSCLLSPLFTHICIEPILKRRWLFTNGQQSPLFIADHSKDPQTKMWIDEATRSEYFVCRCSVINQFLV